MTFDFITNPEKNIQYIQKYTQGDNNITQSLEKMINTSMTSGNTQQLEGIQQVLMQQSPLLSSLPLNGQPLSPDFIMVLLKKLNFMEIYKYIITNVPNYMLWIGAFFILSIIYKPIIFLFTIVLFMLKIVWHIFSFFIKFPLSLIFSSKKYTTTEITNIKHNKNYY